MVTGKWYQCAQRASHTYVFISAQHRVSVPYMLAFASVGSSFGLTFCTWRHWLGLYFWKWDTCRFSWALHNVIKFHEDKVLSSQECWRVVRRCWGLGGCESWGCKDRWNRNADSSLTDTPGCAWKLCSAREDQELANFRQGAWVSLPSWQTWGETMGSVA